MRVVQVQCQEENCLGLHFNDKLSFDQVDSSLRVSHRKIKLLCWRNKFPRQKQTKVHLNNLVDCVSLLIA